MEPGCLSRFGLRFGVGLRSLGTGRPATIIQLHLKASAMRRDLHAGEAQAPAKLSAYPVSVKRPCSTKDARPAPLSMSRAVTGSL